MANFKEALAKAIADYESLEMATRVAYNMLAMVPSPGSNTSPAEAARTWNQLTHAQRGYLRTGMYEHSTTAPRWR